LKGIKVSFIKRVAILIKRGWIQMVNFFGRFLWAVFFYLELHHLGNEYMDAEERTDQLVVVGILENYLQFFFI
jgi:hypothetical protein